MLRNLDLVRTILLELAERQEGNTEELFIDGFDKNTINYHLKIMEQGGLVKNYVVPYVTGEPDSVYPLSITWAGQDFLASAKNNSVWNTVIKNLGAKAVDASFTVLSTYLKNEAAKYIGLPPAD